MLNPPAWLRTALETIAIAVICCLLLGAGMVLSTLLAVWLVTVACQSGPLQ